MGYTVKYGRLTGGLCYGNGCVERFAHPQGRCYSSRVMRRETPVKAFLCAMVEDVPPIIRLINELQPESLCFFAPEPSRALIEQQIQPQLTHLPRRWDWVVTSDPYDLLVSQRALAQQLPPLLDTWDIQVGELVLGLGDVTPGMAAALVLVGLERSSKLLQVLAPAHGSGLGGSTDSAPRSQDVPPGSDEQAAAPWKVIEGNLWDEAAVTARREACQLFNRGHYEAAAQHFRQLARRVSGGQKPFYHALGDMADGYGLWHRMQYRQAWDKLKHAVKALEMAALWGGPPGVSSLVSVVKGHVAFVERIIMDPRDVKEGLTLDLLGQGTRRAGIHQDGEGAMRVLVRALEHAAQWRLLTQHRITPWDVQTELLPESWRDRVQTRYRDEVDGRLTLPTHVQYQLLADLHDELGTRYLKHWPTLMPLVDAANRSVLGHGCEPPKPERVQQFLEALLALLDVTQSMLPTFPTLAL